VEVHQRKKTVAEVVVVVVVAFVDAHLHAAAAVVDGEVDEASHKLPIADRSTTCIPVRDADTCRK
jgi:hypothetical protein